MRVGKRQLVVCAVVGLTVTLATSCSTGASRPEAVRAREPGRPPVVMLVFDEFSTISLLDARGRIDSVRYPNFARLAGDASWFPDATASLDETGRAIRSLFTGRTLWRYAKPSYENHPDNLFTLLGRRYRMRVSEETSSLCPKRLCSHVRTQGRRSILRELRGGRPARFEHWLRSVRRPSHPTLYFKHILLPHEPWIYLPSGRRYGDGPSEASLSWHLWHFNRWLVDQDYQRHLLQVGFTDRLLGDALDRLRATGLYDRSLIVVTADNGESFGRRGNGHEISTRNAADIALTPLIIKLPHQRKGRVDRRHVRTIDVLPTIARVAHLRVDWPVEGRSVFGPAAREIPRSTLVIQRSGRRIRLTQAALRRRAAAALRLKLRLFGSGDAGPGLYGIGPYAFMHGAPTGRWRILPPSARRASVDGAGRYRHVHLRAAFQPMKVTGRLAGRGGRRHTNVAIAVNGMIAATAPTVAPTRNGRQLFSVLLPEGALREGVNRIQVFAIERPDSAPELRPLTP